MCNQCFEGLSCLDDQRQLEKFMNGFVKKKPVAVYTKRTQQAGPKEESPLQQAVLAPSTQEQQQQQQQAEKQ